MVFVSCRSEKLVAPQPLYRWNSPDCDPTAASRSKDRVYVLIFAVAHLHSPLLFSSSQQPSRSTSFITIFKTNILWTGTTRKRHGSWTVSCSLCVSLCFSRPVCLSRCSLSASLSCSYKHVEQQHTSNFLKHDISNVAKTSRHPRDV